MQHTATHCNTLQHTALLQRKDIFVLQCVAVCCSVLQCVAVRCTCAHFSRYPYVVVVQCVAVCCSVLQCAAVCCSVLQCVAVCCSVLHTCSFFKVSLRCSSAASSLVGLPLFCMVYTYDTHIYTHMIIYAY